MAGGCCYEVLHAHIRGERTWTHTWYPAKIVWTCVVPSRQNRYGKCRENRIFGNFGPIFGILTLRGSIFKGFTMMFNGVYMWLPVMMVTLGVSWNIERGHVGFVGARHTPPGHFRPIRITTNSTIFTGKLYSRENHINLLTGRIQNQCFWIIHMNDVAVRDHILIRLAVETAPSLLT